MRIVEGYVDLDRTARVLVIRGLRALAQSSRFQLEQRDSFGRGSDTLSGQTEIVHNM